MRIAYILFDNFNLLDFAGVYDPVSRLRPLGFIPNLEWDICALDDTVMDGYRLAIYVDKIKPDLSGYDVIIIPGGLGVRTQLRVKQFIQWLQTAATVPIKASIGSGSLLLGAAGFLQDKQATTHFDQYEHLAPFCRDVVQRRIVEDFGVITAGAVSSSLDLGLYLCDKLAGKEAMEAVKQRMDYH
jgi:cyclohexyl-isocyanide hydratase